MSLTKNILYKSPLLEVRHVVCRPACCRAGEAEDPEVDTLVLPLRGVFIQHVAPGLQVLAEPNQALFFAAGRLHRISHPVIVGDDCGDDCLAVELSPGGWREVLTAEDLRSSGIGTHGLLSASAMAARSLLWQRLGRGLSTPLEAEDVSLALLSSALRTARREERMPPSREGTRDLRRQQVEEARIALLTEPDRKWTLSALARQVHSSPWHLARIFRDEAGLPVHQYQQRARLARALDLLLETDRELTEIALDLGFSSHSHFTAVFRRLVGLSPSAFRRSAGSREADEARKLLIAPTYPAPLDCPGEADLTSVLLQSEESMDNFSEILLADGPSPEIGDAAGVYGWLIGSWEMDIIDYGDDGSRHPGQGEVHFAWVLEGRAIQDLWIAPRRGERNGAPKQGNRYGTTLRVYDPGLDAWRITWINPVTGIHSHLIGRKVGDDIVQEGRREDGSLMRWSFREITPTSFHWFGERSTDEGRTWHLETEFRVRRS